MDVVFVVVAGLEEDVWVVFSNLEQFPIQMCPQALVDDLPTVFDRNDEMVFTMVYAMAASRRYFMHTP